MIKLRLTRCFAHVLAEKSINFQRQMQQLNELKYINFHLQISMVNWKEGYGQNRV